MDREANVEWYACCMPINIIGCDYDGTKEHAALCDENKATCHSHVIQLKRTKMWR